MKPKPLEYRDISLGCLVDWDDYPVMMRRCRVVAIDRKMGVVQVETIARRLRRDGTRTDQPERKAWVPITALHSTGLVAEGTEAE